MQGLHHQQQQLAALLSAALPKKDASPSSAKPADNDDSARLSAISSLHRAILYPPNSLLVAHSAAFLSQGLSTLLSDKSYAIRQSAATAYGALCAVVCSIPLTSTGRQNHVLLGSMVDRFIGWALPLLSIVTAGDGTTELALDSLREFLNVGDVNGIERYALPILKACQQLLEDERTSLSLLHRLLGVVTLISLKFLRCFQPHFLDIVDLLLGWALAPDLVEADRRVIMDCFLQFQKHWVGNLQFSLGLLSKFLGDMESLLQDGALGTTQHFGRLLALLSCFSTVLQSTASGLLELNLLEQIIEPLSKMLPRLLACLSIIGRRFGWSKWNGDLWRCLTLLAEILREKFSDFYPLAVNTLFQSLENCDDTLFGGAGKASSSQVHGVLRTNLQLLSLQKFGLLPSSVEKIMHFESPISQLRLHPNHVVTASSAATYVFLLQHANQDVVEQAMASLLAELEILKRIIEKALVPGDEYQENDGRTYSNLELYALVKFDLKVLLTCVSLGGNDSLLSKSDIAIVHLKRSDILMHFITKNLNPLEHPILASVELQVSVMVMLERLSKIELLSKCSTCAENSRSSSVDVTAEKNLTNISASNLHSVVMEHFRKYGRLLVKALHVSSPLAIKLVSLEWVQGLCENIIALTNSNSYFFRSFVHSSALWDVIVSILVAASDKEPKVRSHVTSVLELLVKARLVHPVNFYSVVQTVLEKLGDPDNSIKNMFTRLLSHLLPDMIYSCGLCDYGTSIEYGPDLLRVNSSVLHWKQVFARKQLPQRLQAQQLGSVLSYISQRWKVPLSSWIQRLIHTCQKSEDLLPSQSEGTKELGTSGSWLDMKVDEDFLENVCSANVLAGAWWAMQEAARYCIATRLRTNLGGPSLTFAALERMILDISHVLQLDGEQNDGSLGIINSSGAHLLPMRLLLDFVEALKKNVYNAYEGSAILPSVSRPSSLFFRANKKVCEEWFSRTCEPMMNAGLALQCPHATIEYCTLRLHDLNSAVASTSMEKSRVPMLENLQSIKTRFLGDILRVLRHMALALCRCHEPEALIGLQTWVSQKFSSLLDEETHSKDHSGDSGPLVWITGLVYQAKGEYERAAAYFTHLLQTEESLSSLGSDGVQFAIARIIESYSAVSDWKSLESWLLELQMLRAKHAGKNYCGALTAAGNDVNAIHALSHFDRSDFSAAWACLDLTPKSSGELTLDPKLALQRSEQMLLQAMLLQVEGKEERVLHDVQKAKLMLEEILPVLPLDGIEEAALCATQLHCILAFEDAFNAKDSQERAKRLDDFLVSPYVQMVHCPIEIARQDCNLWLKVLRVYRTISPSSPATLNLCMNLSRLARKQKNLMLAHRLNDYLRKHVSRCSVDRFLNFQISNLEYEEVLLMHAEDKYEDAFTNLWSYVRPCMVSSASFIPNADETILKAKACLKLSNWLHGHKELCLEVIAPRIQEDFNRADFSCIDQGGIVSTADSFKRNVHTIIDEISGTAIKLSTQLCPSMGKTWMSYGSWCFSLARNSLLNPPGYDSVLQSCSFSPFLESEVQPGTFKLNQGELDRVNTVISQMFTELGENSLLKDKEGDENVYDMASENSGNDHRFKALVQQLLNIIESSAGVPGAENSSSESLSTTVASRLHMCFLHGNFRSEETEFVVNQLVEIWWSLRRRRVNLFGHAAKGFIQYLSYSSSMICNGEMVGSCYKSLKTGSYTLKATLYVLHILLNYGVELHDTLEPSLSAIPLWPWQEVTPQLFARLSSHPEQLVRNQLQGLLMMLGKRSPWSIVYPTLLDANEANPSEELLQILGCLRELHPRLIQDVQLMINELGNVTVLWEELWLSTLQDLHADVMRRIHVLREEAARIAGNATLSQSEKSKINAAKYSAMMAPIFVTLERRLASTSRKPETPHEMWFHQQYTEQLKLAILAFKTPPKSASALADVWRPFDTMAACLASCQRKSSVSLGEVAPQLALLSSSDVPMPGLEKQVIVSESDRGGTTDAQGIVTISSFFDQVTVLSTKTKPKKINIMGSDGQKYTYLLKGREDLRLDARIMQLLQAINSFLQTSQETRGHLIGVRYYSVTPISGRAGLIQWVHNVTSIYSVFKCWQTRIQLAQQSANGDTKDASPSVPRPSDMFYGKIIPALKEQGIKRVISRRDWPHDVKRKVLVDLMKEVPRQLLYQEFWCASEGFKAFSSKLKRYSGSIAAMSMVGHILGLGDRHLDNILVDFYSGDVVHIDYNVCFNKGQRLKIPEIVPFRLTQMIEAALGLTGIEGTFKASCEAVVGVMRKNKDVLLMLLEVFVWDPLVEWTRGDFHDDAAIGGEERKGMELAVSLSLFASRVQEIRVPLEEHRDLLLSTLPAIESALERFADVLSKYELVSALFYRADKERSSLILHETSAKSIVAEATSNSEKIRVSFESHAREYSQAKASVTEKANEATNWIEQHVRVLDALRGDLILETNAWIKLNAMGEALSLKSAVLVAGVPLSVVPEPTQVQCHDIDREVSQLVTELDHGVASALGSLQVYSLALRRILPLSYQTTSIVNRWAQVLQLCSNVLSSDSISLARRHGSELFSNTMNKGHDSIQNVHNDLCFKLDKYALDVERVKGEHSELLNSIGSETESRVKERLLSSFMKYIQSASVENDDGTHLPVQSGQHSYNSTRDARHQREWAEKKEIALLVLNLTIISFYKEVHDSVLSLGSNARVNSSYDFLLLFGELEEQVEKCILISSFLNEISPFSGCESSDTLVDSDDQHHFRREMFPSIFKRILHSCITLVDQMTEVILPDVVRAAISHNSEFMDMFGSISQVRGTLDSALEQLLEVELERASLVELEQNYFVKVGLVTERQLVLKEAALKSRDHLSWEEAEELASQEESCRVQLDQFHQSWNQREKRTYYLMKRESEIRSVFISCEHHFQTLVNAEEDVDLNVPRSKVLLAGLVKPFSELDSVDEVSSALRDAFAFHDVNFNIADFINSGHSVSENVWKLGGLVNHHAFFIWKVFVMDSFVDSCIQDIASSVDQSLGFDQLLIVMKQKLAIQLEKNIALYLKARFLPSMASWLEKEIERLKQMKGVTRESTFDYVRRDLGAVNKVQLMLEEYSNAHETARAAKAAAFFMEKQVKELEEGICRTGLEIVQMEWMNDTSMSPSQNSRALLQKYISVDDDLHSAIPNLSRLKLLESLQSSVSRIAQSLEGLQSVERTSLTAEGQLERAVGWACGVPTSAAAGQSSSKISGIPPEFHQHLMRRQQSIWDAREKASDIIKICMSVLEFEASRDGILWVPGEVLPFRAGGDDRAWQQAYFNAVTRLDVSYHSFSRIEQEWNLAQSSMEAASSSLSSATNELTVASLKARTASDELQSTVLAMRDCAYEASIALSSFSRVSKSHTALTSECGSMLEEVMAITDDLHDVHSLGKEAAIMHRSLMEDLSKANSILLPLESVLSKDATAMTDAIARERETKMEISPIHGQAIYQSYYSRVREATQTSKPLMPSLVMSAKELFSLLTRLARAASLHAGNLHKAFEGVGDSQKEKSQGLDMSKTDFDGDGSSLDSETGEQSTSNEEGKQGILGIAGLSLQDKGWISPPDSICCSSSGSGLSSTEASLPDSSADPTEEMPQSKLLEVKDSRVLVSGGSSHEEESTVQNLDSLQQQDTVELKSAGKDEMPIDKVRTDDENDEAPSANRPTNGRVIRGKNNYAMSVLRRVEMKLDGRDISDTRDVVSISEQVNYLLKQATSLDNLCNMYEGWTPWI